MPDPQVPPIFRIDVSSAASSSEAGQEMSTEALIRQMVVAQTQTNELLGELLQQLSAAQKQRAIELGQWKDANPVLAARCRQAAESLGRVQTEFLTTLTEEILDNEDCLSEGEFMLNEFVDRFGPRLAHLNGVLQVLSQLSAVPATPNSSPQQ